jgi:hypothetical protein
MRRAAGRIRRVAPLGYDAFQPELAGMLEHKRAVFFVEVFVEA